MKASLVYLAVVAAAVVVSGAVRADLIEVSFEGSVQSISQGLQPTLTAGDLVTGSLTIDTSVAGTFTPAANEFDRSTMVYAGAVTAISITVNGETVTGTGGDVTLFNAEEIQQGADQYLATAALTGGTVGGHSPIDGTIDLFYEGTTFTVDEGSPLFGGPPPFSSANYAAFYLNFEADALSPSGNFASGPITSLIPEPSTAAVFGLGLVGVGLARRRCRAGM